jgi:general stress protein 26
MTEHDDNIATISKIVKASKIATLTTVTSEGHLHSRPLAAQDVEFDGDLWFFTKDPSAKVEELHTNPQVNAAFQSSDGYLSIAGVAEVVRDRAKVDQYWSPAVEAWFPDGKDDPSIALIKVHADSAELWATDDPKVVTAFKLVAAAATGHRPDVGENRSVEL